MKIKFDSTLSYQQEAIDSMEGQTIWLTSVGVNEKGEQVSEMQFEWSIKVRK